MRSIARRRSLVITLALSAGLVAGCIQPTLPPLPPPDAPRVSEPVDGEVELSGTLPVARARVLAWNHDTGVIAGQAVEDAEYRFTIRAESGHALELWYLSGGDQSEGVAVTVPEISSDAESAPASDAGVE